MKYKLLLVIGCLLMAIGCQIEQPRRYNQGTFPETVINLGDINSIDDDYNSTSPVFGDVLPLLFSSKRSGRTDFNFVRESLNYTFDRRSGDFSFNNRPYGGLDILEEQLPISWAADKVNSNGNELGPYIKSYERDLIKDGMNRHYGEYLMLYASDRTGNLDIYLTHNYQDNPASATVASGATSAVSNKKFVDPVPLVFLNSAADDAYPCFSNNNTSIYFTSNRSGDFDIYRTLLPGIQPIALQSSLPTLSELPVERITVLSSTADDKCPYIQDNMLVFTSNRPGGFGGFDLYYSKWEVDKWSAPVNFGPTINTASDEYRPILVNPMEFTNQMMIFSSNRPGGKGGFDLYMVGVKK